MSKEVDERVVSMQFDNRQFERNVQTTMSTLDKLKQKLHLPGAAKSIENVNAAASKFDASPMARGLDAVKVKFSAMEIAGITVITNLTNSAINAGKRIASALTIDPVKTGFNEYELKMDSVKTIMASTGEDIERVNELLDELNQYSDQTIYSFSDMTQNIGKFTNAGVKLEDAVLAIKGISNEAALSGANANEASRAMYNFAQALSVGYIQRIDWKSIELANMATLEFKEQLLNAAIAAGTVKKSADGMYATLSHPEKAYNASAMFTETLDEQWLTTEVLISTLKDYSDATTDIGKRAFAAAQDVTKLSQMFDILKETAQSGWARTWEIIFGDLNKAKSVFTPLTNFFSKFIDGMNDVRNAVLEGALGKTFKSLLEPIKGIKKTVDTITEPIEKITKSLEDYNKVVKEVIRGDWGVTQKRWDALAAAGYDWATVQNMVNEELNCSVRHATNFSFGQAKVAEATEEVVETNNAYIASLTKMSDAELKSLNLTDEQIEAVRALKKEADKLGLSVEDFLANIDKLDGRWVVIQTFKNIGEALGKVFKTVAQAWKEIFPPKSIEERSNALYNLIAALHKFSLKLKMSDETADKLKRTLKGIFAVIDIITTITGGAFKVAIKVLCKVLGALNIDVLSVTASVGDAIVAFRDWLLNGNMLAKGLKKVVEVGKTVVSVIAKWVKAFLEIPVVQNGVKKLTGFLVKAFEVGRDTIKGLVNGLRDGTISVVDIVTDIGKKIISTIKNILDIHSPSRVMFEIGTNIIQGLVNGIKSLISAVGDVAAHVVSTLMNVLGKIDLSKIAAIGVLAGGFGILYGVIKLILGIGKMTKSLANMFDGIGDVIHSFSNVLDNFAGTLKAFSLNLKAKAIKEIAIAIAILVGSLAVLTLLNPDRLFSSILIIGVMAGVLAALMFVMDKYGGKGGVKESLNLGALSVALIGMGLAIMMIAAATKMMGNMDEDAASQGIAIVSTLMLELGLLLVAFGIFTNGRQSKNIDKAGKLFTKLAVAMLLLAIVVKIIGGMEEEALTRSMIVVGGGIVLLGGVVAGLIALSKFAGNKIASVTKMLTKVAVAMLILAVVVKMMAKMEPEDMKRGAAGLTMLVVAIAGLILSTKAVGKNDISSLGGTLLKISIAIGILAIVAKSIAKMSWGEMGKAAAGIGFMTVIIAMLVGMLDGIKNVEGIGKTLLSIAVAVGVLGIVAKLIATMELGEMVKAAVGLAGLVVIVKMLVKITQGMKEPEKMAATILALSVAVGILAGVAILIGFIELPQLAKGIVAVGILAAMLGILVGCTRFAQDIYKSLFAMTAAIAVMAIAVAGLSFIEPKKLAGATAAMSILMGMFSVMIISTKLAKSCLKDLLVMTAIVAILAVIIYKLADLPVDRTLGAAGALSILLTSLSTACLACAVIGKLGASVYQGMTAMAVMLVGAVAILTLIGTLFNAVDGLDKGLDKALEILGKIGTAIGTFFGNIVGGFMEGVMSGLPAVGQSLSDFMNNAEDFIKGANKIKSGSMKAIKDLASAILALTAAKLVNQLVSFLGGGKNTISEFGKQIVPFGEAMVEFSGIVAGNIDEEAVSAAASAGKCLTEMVKTIPKTGGVIQFFTGKHDWEEFNKQIVPFGEAMTSFSATVAGNIDGEAVTAAANAGKCLTEMVGTIPKSGGVIQMFTGEHDWNKFNNQIVPFGAAIAAFSKEVSNGNIDSEAVTAAASSGKMLASLAKDLPKADGLMQKLTGYADWTTFNTEIVQFAKALCEMSTELNKGTFDAGKINAAAAAGQMLGSMAANLPTADGLMQKLTGYTDWTTFNTEIVSFSESIVEMSEVLNKGTYNPEKVESAAKAGEALGKMASTIPATKDFWDFIKSDRPDWSAFSKGIKGYAQAITEFSDILGPSKAALEEMANKPTGIVSIDPLSQHSENVSAAVQALEEFKYLDLDAIQAASKAGVALAEMASTIPTTKDIWDFFDSDVADWPAFTKGVESFGIAIKKFGMNAKENPLTAQELDSYGDNIKKILTIFDMFKDGDDWKWYTNEDGDFVQLNRNVESLGSVLNKFCMHTAAVDTTDAYTKVTRVKQIIEAIGSIPEWAYTDDTSKFAAFSDELVKFSTKMKEFVENLNGIEITNDSAITDFTTLLKTMVGEGTTEALKYLEEYGDLGLDLARVFQQGCCSEDAKTAINLGMWNLYSHALVSFDAESLEADFKTYGANVAQGLADGITFNAHLACKAAEEMAQAVQAAARSALKINSPSKVFYAIGSGVIEGFVGAVDDGGQTVYKSGSNLAQSVRNGFSKALSKVRDILNNGIDARPTIRPVLDLSDVESGVGSINGMFDSSPSIGLMSNIRAISSSMNSRQNGGNADVVSAIKDLKGTLSKLSGNHYSVNGISYNDESVVSDAIETLVQATRIDRRR